MSYCDNLVVCLCSKLFYMYNTSDCHGLATGQPILNWWVTSLYSNNVMFYVKVSTKSAPGIW